MATYIEDVGLGLASEGTEHDDQSESKDLPFCAIDLLEGMFALRSEVAKQPRASHSLALDEPGSPALFGPPNTPSEPFHLQNVPESMQAESQLKFWSLLRLTKQIVLKRFRAQGR